MSEAGPWRLLFALNRTSLFAEFLNERLKEHARLIRDGRYSEIMFHLLSHLPVFFLSTQRLIVIIYITTKPHHVSPPNGL